MASPTPARSSRSTLRLAASATRRTFRPFVVSLKTFTRLSSASVVTAIEAPSFDVGGATITGLASPSQGSAHNAAWRVRFAPDQPSPLHSLSREEIFVVLEGELTVCFADRDETVGAGGALIVPAGEEFTLVARGAAAEAVCIMTVGGQAVTNGAAFTPPWAE